MINPNWRLDIGCRYGDMVVVGTHGAKRVVYAPRNFAGS